MARRAGPGEGRPYQRSSDGRWVVVVRDADNRRRPLYAWSKPEVLAKRDEFLGLARSGLTPPTGKLTVGRHLREWLDAQRDHVRPSTWIGYEAHVRIHLAMIHAIPLSKLTPNDVRRLMRDRLEQRCSPSTVGHTLTVLRMALGQAVRDGLVVRNVATLVDAPRVQREPIRILERAKIRRLLDVAPTARNGALWVLLVGTGLRLGEALGLRWQDVDLTARRPSLTVVQALRARDRRVREEGAPRLELVEPKTEASRRTIALPSFVTDALVRHRESAAGPKNVLGLVFTTGRGRPLDQRNASRSFAHVLGLAGLPPMRIHDLRHTTASLLLASGASLHDVKEQLGHSSIAMTSDIYGHLVAGRSGELADALDRAIGAG